MVRDCSSYSGPNDPNCDNIKVFVTATVRFSSFHIILPRTYTGNGSEVRTKTKGIGQCNWATTHTYSDTVICTFDEQAAHTEVQFQLSTGKMQPDGSGPLSARLPDGAGAELYLDVPKVGTPVKITGP